MSVTNNTGIEPYYDLTEAVADLYVTMRFGGSSFSVVQSDLMGSGNYMIEGDMPDIDMSVIGALSDMPATPPSRGDAVEVDGKRYRVEYTDTGADGQTYTMLLSGRSGA